MAIPDSRVSGRVFVVAMGNKGKGDIGNDDDGDDDDEDDDGDETPDSKYLVVEGECDKGKGQPGWWDRWHGWSPDIEHDDQHNDDDHDGYDDFDDDDGSAGGILCGNCSNFITFLVFAEASHSHIQPTEFKRKI